MQNEIQNSGTVTELDWNSYDNRMLGKYVGRTAMMAGIQGAVLGAGFSLAAKLVSDKPVEFEDVVADALRTGADTSIKAATAGAITVAAKRGLLGVITPLTETVPIAHLACVAVENVKTLGRAAAGELTAGEALDQMAGNTVAMYYGLGCSAAGMAIGAAALAWIPIAGPVIGGLTGGVIGYAAGSKFGQSVYKAAKTVAKSAFKTVKKATEGAKKISERMTRSIGRLFRLA